MPLAGALTLWTAWLCVCGRLGVPTFFPVLFRQSVNRNTFQLWILRCSSKIEGNQKAVVCGGCLRLHDYPVRVHGFVSFMSPMKRQNFCVAPSLFRCAYVTHGPESDVTMGVITRRPMRQS